MASTASGLGAGAGAGGVGLSGWDSTFLLLPPVLKSLPGAWGFLGISQEISKRGTVQLITEPYCCLADLCVLTRPPLAQVFILVLDEHIVIMLIVLAGQPEAEREGVPPNCFPSLEQLVVCKSPDRQRLGDRWGEGRKRPVQCSGLWSWAAGSTWFAERKGSGIGAKDGSAGPKHVLLDSVGTLFRPGPVKVWRQIDRWCPSPSLWW